MKRDLTITGVFCLIELALVFIPWILPLFPSNPTRQQALDATLGMLGVHFAVLIAYLGLILAIHSAERRIGYALLDQGLKRGEVRKERDDEFYNHFLWRAELATSYVYISYFAPYPPQDISSIDRKKYYEAMLKTIRKKSGVRFRRLIRDSPDNHAWIRQLISDLQNKSNADVGVIDDSKLAAMPLALSVQIIDARYTWLVATRSHERQGDYRDLFIDDALISEELTAYHDRLWDSSIKLLDSGRLTPDGQTFTQVIDDAKDSGEQKTRT